MAGKRQQQKREREARILRVAGALFEKPGYTATAMGDIAERAGLAVGTLYNYFPSKPEIALAIVRGDTSGALAAGEAIVKRPPEGAITAVCSLLDLYLEPFEERPRALWRQLMAAAVVDPEEIGGRFFAEDLRLITQLGSLLRELQSRGDVAAGVETGRSAIALYGVYIGWVMAFIASDELDATGLRSEIHRGIRITMEGVL